MVDLVLALLWPDTRAPLLCRRRAEALVRRVRIFARLFALLTAAWVAVDAWAFPFPAWLQLATLRLSAATAFMALALGCGLRPATLPRAEACLAALFAVPAAFFLASLYALDALDDPDLARGVAAVYTFVPFVLAAGIAAFPLYVAESAALAAIAFAIEAAALGLGPLPVWLPPADIFWLLGLIAVVAAFSSASQLGLLAELVRQAVRDPLTGCHRRESGKELLDVQFLLALRHRAPLTVLFVDLDRFKEVNDEYGHEAGDHVLRAAAASLRGMLRESDSLLRWGGEEFLVVLPHTSRVEAVALLERLRLLGLGLRPDGRAVTVSIGIAEFPSDAAASAEELIELADRRMYEAKQAGRNRYVDAGGASAKPLLPATALSG